MQTILDRAPAAGDRFAVHGVVHRSLRIAVLASALSALAFAGAYAQDETVSANSSRPMPLGQAVQAAPLKVGPDDADSAPESAAPVRDGKVHGMVEAGIGTNGYRHAGVQLVAPLGEEGVIAIAVSQTQVNRPTRR